MHEAIIDKEMWEAARLRYKETGTKWDKTHSLEHEIILDMVADPEFKDYMVGRIDEKVNVSSLEAERNQIREQLRQDMETKKKLTEMLDRLDIPYDRISKKHLSNKYIKLMKYLNHLVEIVQHYIL